MHAPDAPPTLAPLLRRLLEEAETGISQHAHEPRPDKWYAGRGDAGDFGPYPSAEDAIVALVRILWRDLDEARADCGRAWEENARLVGELEEARQVAGAVAAELLRVAGAGGRG